MDSQYITDNHTLYVRCGCASAEQIRNSFKEALTTYQTKNQVDLACSYKVNLVEDKEGISFQIAFVFVSNPAVYYMLLGKNPDGTDRVEYRDDPSWAPPTAGESVNDAGWSTISPPVYTQGKSWADMADEDEEYESQLEAERQKYVPRKIKIALDPLMTLPPYTLTPDQIEYKRDMIIDENEDKLDFNPDLIQIPTEDFLKVQAGVAKPVESTHMPNILKATRVPEWVGHDDLKVQFAPYASDRTSIQHRTIKGQKFEDTYPFVNINDDRVAFVIFDPSTNDAYFALHMMKKTIISKRMKSGIENRVVLIFAHSYRTDRDMMADITQRPRMIQRDDESEQPSRDQDGYRGRGGNGGRGRGRGRGGNGGQRGGYNGQRGGYNDQRAPRYNERRDEGPRAIHRAPPRGGVAPKPSFPIEGKNHFAALAEDD